jgi:hypothetical protein
MMVRDWIGRGIEKEDAPQVISSCDLDIEPARLVLARLIIARYINKPKD